MSGLQTFITLSSLLLVLSLLSSLSLLFPYSWNKTNERWCRGDHSLNHRKKEKLILLTVIKVCTFVSCDFLCEGFLLSRESSSSFLFLLLIDCHFLSLPMSLSLSLSFFFLSPSLSLSLTTVLLLNLIIHFLYQWRYKHVFHPQSSKTDKKVFESEESNPKAPPKYQGMKEKTWLVNKLTSYECHHRDP